MKSFTAILVLALISSTIAVSSSRSQLFLGKQLTAAEQLGQHHLGKALLSMAQVGSNSGYSLDDLYDALNLLRNSLQEKLDAENSAYEVEEGEKNAQQTAIQAKIDKYTANLNTYNNDLSDLETTAGELKTKGDNLADTLSTTQGSLDSYNTKLSTLESDTEKELQDFDDAVALLGEAREKLVEAKHSASSASFIEMKRPQFMSLVEKFETKLAALEKTETLMASQIARAFAQIASGNASDSDSIKNAIDALDDLTATLVQGRKDCVTNYEANKDAYQTIIGELGDQVQRLELISIPANTQAQENNAEQQEAKGKQISSATVNKEFEEGLMEDLVRQWDMRVNIHDTLTSNLEDELKIVDQAESVVRAGH